MNSAAEFDLRDQVREERARLKRMFSKKG